MDWNFDSGIFQNIANGLLGVLPDSPFTKYINMFQSLPDLAVLNWFFPIAEMLLFWETLTVLWAGYFVVIRILRLLRFL